MALQDYIMPCDRCEGGGEIYHENFGWRQCPRCGGSGVRAVLPPAVPKGTFLLAHRGSIAHGMYVPSDDPKHLDDVDIMGVVFAPKSNYLGMTPMWSPRGAFEYKQQEWDCVYYEIRKMVQLLLKGNPNVMGLLWCRKQDYLRLTPSAEEMIRCRNLFVGKHIFESFVNYAAGQMEKMETQDPAELREYLAVTAELKVRGMHPNCEGECVPYPADYDSTTGIAKDVSSWSSDRLLARMRSFQKKGQNIGYLGDKRKQLLLEHGFDCKNAAHCIRLLRMCIEFLKTGEMVVYRPDAAELLEIKKGEWPLDRIKQHALELFDIAHAEYKKCKLPERPDEKGAEDLLVRLVWEHLKNE